MYICTHTDTHTDTRYREGLSTLTKFSDIKIADMPCRSARSASSISVDVTYMYDDVTYVYDDVTYVCGC